MVHFTPKQRSSHLRVEKGRPTGRLCCPEKRDIVPIGEKNPVLRNGLKRLCVSSVIDTVPDFSRVARDCCVAALPLPLNVVTWLNGHLGYCVIVLFFPITTKINKINLTSRLPKDPDKTGTSSSSGILACQGVYLSYTAYARTNGSS